MACAPEGLPAGLPGAALGETRVGTSGHCNEPSFSFTEFCLYPELSRLGRGGGLQEDFFMTCRDCICLSIGLRISVAFVLRPPDLRGL